MKTPPDLTGARSLGGSRTERLVLLFVLVALATLVAVPLLVNRRVGHLRAEIEASEPARTLVTSLQFQLVSEMAALGELLLSRDTTAASEYDTALLQEDSIYRELEPLARQLGADVLASYHEVRRRALIWHSRAADARDLLRQGAREDLTRPRRERQLFDSLLDSTRALDVAILDRTIQIRREIEAAERLGLNISIGLGFLALCAGGAAAVLADRSRRYARESELRRAGAERALEEVAHATELRQRLLRGITHDVKNPLGAAKGYADLLLMEVKAPIHPQQVPLVTGIMRSVDGALAIIGDLLDMARADSGSLAVKRVESDLATVARETVEDLRPAAEAAGHVVQFRLPEEPLRVYTDPARVQQILQNLLSNAVKYTPPPGTITVSVESYADEASGGRRWAAVRVADNGPGIPPELRERIFDEFTRLEDGSAIKGHGLGLSIARRIARMLGGDLVVVDSAQPGATFLLKLPLREGAELDGKSSHAGVVPSF